MITKFLNKEMSSGETFLYALHITAEKTETSQLVIILKKIPTRWTNFCSKATIKTTEHLSTIF